MTRRAWADRFDRRYGAGEFACLFAWLQDPRRTYSSIAARYGVSRERVRQWHRLLMPDAPAGRERRRQQRRREDWAELVGDSLFGAFYVHARECAPGAKVRPVRTTHGYSRGRVTLDNHEIALRRATPRVRKDHRARILRVARPAAPVAFVYILLPDGGFFLLPAHLVPVRGGAIVDTAAELQRFRNTFDAVRDAGADPSPAVLGARAS